MERLKSLSAQNNKTIEENHNIMWLNKDQFLFFNLKLKAKIIASVYRFLILQPQWRYEKKNHNKKSKTVKTIIAFNLSLNKSNNYKG